MAWWLSYIFTGHIISQEISPNKVKQRFADRLFKKKILSDNFGSRETFGTMTLNIMNQGYNVCGRRRNPSAARVLQPLFIYLFEITMEHEAIIKLEICFKFLFSYY